jgi:hypothetical protein
LIKALSGRVCTLPFFDLSSEFLSSGKFVILAGTEGFFSLPFDPNMD